MDLTEKRRIEKARTPIRRSVKAQSTPPKAFRSRPSPLAAVEASISAIAAQQSSGVGGRVKCLISRAVELVPWLFRSLFNFLRIVVA